MTDENKAKQSFYDSVLLVLTLKRHREGVWIHRLVEALERTRRKHTNGVAERDIGIRVVALEDMLSSPFVAEDWFSSRYYNEDWLRNKDLSHENNHRRLRSRIIGLVNRVSDAAPPTLFKACMAVLSSAESRHIPIFNGPRSYTMSSNKWCHHVLFDQAKLKSPPTAAFFSATHRDSTDAGKQFQEATQLTMHRRQKKAAANTKNESLNSPNFGSITAEEGHDILIKPNAGGFGEGIVRVSLGEATAGSLSGSLTMPEYSDQMTLIQSYVSPNNLCLYRIWYLLGKVQCAVERRLDPELPSTHEEFTTACAGGNVCTRRPKRQRMEPQDVIFQQFVAWEVPEEVRKELEERFLPTLPADAHCGSVEFLDDSTRSLDSTVARQRLYFDWNLLSTLPIDVEETSRKSIWPAKYDPWDELAIGIWEFVAMKNCGRDA